ncbi:hypothetical protein A2U01_0100083, partial [Trifolium medium]|nr:hypothetical protein [Trifolium medium]
RDTIILDIFLKGRDTALQLLDPLIGLLLGTMKLAGFTSLGS